MQSEQGSKRKEEVNARKGGGCRAGPRRGKGRWRPLHSHLTGTWCGSRYRISSPASEKVAPLPYLLSQQYRKGGGSVVALTSPKRSQAHRETESLEVTPQMKNMAGEWPGLLGYAPSSSSCCFCGPHCFQEAAEVGLGKRWLPPRACQV